MSRVGSPLSRNASRAWRPTIGNTHAILLSAPLLLLFAVFVAYPFTKLTLDSFTTGAGPLDNYRIVLTSPAGRRALWTTISAAALVTLISVFAASVLAWYLTSVRSRWLRGILFMAVLVPFWMGTVVKNYAIVILLTNNGPLNDMLEALHIGRVSLLYTENAVILGMIYTMIPYAAFVLYAVFATIDRQLIAAARSLGASNFTIAHSVFLPLAMPGILASAVLVFAISLGFYVTPVILGGAQAPFMASLIEAYILTTFDYPLASAASVLLLATAVISVVAVFAIIGKERIARAIA